MRRLNIAIAGLAAFAALATLPAAGAGQLWLAASDNTLEQMRGGFTVRPGLTVSFGILRTVEINGVLVSSSGFQIANLGSINVAQAEQLARQAESLNLVQNGPGNAFNANAQPGLPALVIQNTLSDQKIRTLTEINAVSNGMSLLKGLNLTQSLNDAIGAAAR